MQSDWNDHAEHWQQIPVSLKMSSPVFSPALQHYITSMTPVDICSSHRCAVMQHKCTAALVKAEYLPHCSMLLCNTGSQQVLYPCNQTYGDLLFTQMCSDVTPMHSSTGQGQNTISIVQCCSAKQAHSRYYVTSMTSMDICPSYCYAVIQHGCTAVLLRA